MFPWSPTGSDAPRAPAVDGPDVDSIQDSQDMRSNSANSSKPRHDEDNRSDSSEDTESEYISLDDAIPLNATIQAAVSRTVSEPWKSRESMSPNTARSAVESVGTDAGVPRGSDRGGRTRASAMYQHTPLKVMGSASETPQSNKPSGPDTPSADTSTPVRTYSAGVTPLRTDLSGENSSEKVGSSANRNSSVTPHNGARTGARGRKVKATPAGAKTPSLASSTAARQLYHKRVSDLFNDMHAACESIINKVSRLHQLVVSADSSAQLFNESSRPTLSWRPLMNAALSTRPTSSLQHQMQNMHSSVLSVNSHAEELLNKASQIHDGGLDGLVTIVNTLLSAVWSCSSVAWSSCYMASLSSLRGAQWLSHICGDTAAVLLCADIMLMAVASYEALSALVERALQLAELLVERTQQEEVKFGGAGSSKNEAQSSDASTKVSRPLFPGGDRQGVSELQQADSSTGTTENDMTGALSQKEQSAAQTAQGDGAEASEAPAKNRDTHRHRGGRKSFFDMRFLQRQVTELKHNLQDLKTESVRVSGYINSPIFLESANSVSSGTSDGISGAAALALPFIKAAKP